MVAITTVRGEALAPRVLKSPDENPSSVHGG